MSHSLERHTPMMQPRDFPYENAGEILATYTATYTETRLAFSTRSEFHFTRLEYAKAGGIQRLFKSRPA